MNEETSRPTLSKKGQRHVSPFTGNELLYDYLLGKLDDERKAAVEEHLQNSREAQSNLKKIENGIAYTEKLKRVTLSKGLAEKINAPSSYLTILFQKSRFEQWPVGIKWGLEALIVVFVIVTFLSLAPWEKVLKLRLATSTEDVILTEINKASSVSQNPKEPTTEVAAAPEFVDEGLKPKEVPTPGPTAVSAVAVKPTLPPVPKATPIAKTQKPVVVEDEIADEKSPASTGFLYRGVLAVTNLAAIEPKITEKIKELGGRKAGDVELGWKKTPESAYYHFTIPEAKYEELQTFFSGYGKVRISKDKHPRVMPDGIIRLIITVDEANK